MATSPEAAEQALVSDGVESMPAPRSMQERRAWGLASLLLVLLPAPLILASVLNRGGVSFTGLLSSFFGLVGLFFGSAGFAMALVVWRWTKSVGGERDPIVIVALAVGVIWTAVVLLILVWGVSFYFWGTTTR